MKPEGVYKENSKMKTDASDIMSKSVEKSKKSVSNKIDKLESNVESRSNKITKLGTEFDKSVIETDIQLHTKSTSQNKQFNVL